MCNRIYAFCFDVTGNDSSHAHSTVGADENDRDAILRVVFPCDY